MGGLGREEGKEGSGVGRGEILGRENEDVKFLHECSTYHSKKGGGRQGGRRGRGLPPLPFNF